jgi:hypothetical protein
MPGEPADQGPPRGRRRAALVLLGTFHFRDRGLDAYRPRFAFDVSAPERQREIGEVVERLAAFRPTRVAVERHALRQAELDAEYAAYRRGAFSLPADEVYQLGFRLAGRCGHPRVYGVNAWDRHYEPWGDLEAYAWAHGEARLFADYHGRPSPVAEWARAHGQAHLLLEGTARFRKRAARGDRRKSEAPLRETLLRTNAPAAIRRSHGQYLVGAFKVGAGAAYPGVDWVTAWYNRNLRIFANLQRITEGPGGRLLLIIGAGHLPILRHCAQASPEYELVEARRYLGAPPAPRGRHPRGVAAPAIGGAGAHAGPRSGALEWSSGGP